MVFFTYIVFVACVAITSAIGANDINYSFDDNTTNRNINETNTFEGEYSSIL